MEGRFCVLSIGNTGRSNNMTEVICRRAGQAAAGKGGGQMQVGAIGSFGSLYGVRQGGSGPVRPVQAVGAVASRGDSVSISPLGRAMQMLQALEERRQSVVEQKNALIAKTLEKGDSLDSIEGQLETFEELLLTLDEMSDDILASQTQNAVDGAKDKAENAKKAEDEEPVTQEEADARQAGAMTLAAAGVEQGKAVQSVSRQLTGRANVLDRQVAQDRGTMKIRKPKPGDMAATREYLADKSGKARALRAQAKQAYLNTASVSRETLEGLAQARFEGSRPVEEDTERENADGRQAPLDVVA